MSSVPPEAVVEAFGLRPLERPSLAGARGDAWRIGDLVIKPAPDEHEWAWLGELLPTIKEHGFRLALPVPAVDGRWIVDGWCAQTWLAGGHADPPRWLEVLTVSERFHHASAHLPRPGFIDRRTHPWAVGDRVAWEEEEADPPTDDPRLRRLLTLRRGVTLPSQLIHGDLTGNVLFAGSMAPAVIDPTPYWRPAGFANAIVVHDAICWLGADPTPLLAANSHLEAFPQLFLRAVAYRLVASLLLGSVDDHGVDRVVDLAVELAG